MSADGSLDILFIFPGTRLRGDGELFLLDRPDAIGTSSRYCLLRLLTAPLVSSSSTPEKYRLCPVACFDVLTVFFDLSSSS